MNILKNLRDKFEFKSLGLKESPNTEFLNVDNEVAVSILNDGTIVTNAAPVDDNHLTNKEYVDKQIGLTTGFVKLATNQVIAGDKKFTNISTTSSTSSVINKSKWLYNWTKAPYKTFDLTGAIMDITVTMEGGVKTSKYMVELIQGEVPRNVIFNYDTITLNGVGNVVTGIANVKQYITLLCTSTENQTYVILESGAAE